MQSLGVVGFLCVCFLLVLLLLLFSNDKEKLANISIRETHFFLWTSISKTIAVSATWLERAIRCYPTALQTQLKARGESATEHLPFRFSVKTTFLETQLGMKTTGWGLFHIERKLSWKCLRYPGNISTVLWKKRGRELKLRQWWALINSLLVHTPGSRILLL